ncbi:MAG: hypothetical protein HGA56_00470 [Chlorobiaceae bacterium]|nr:hypothetical protein [Chlorobiaceae bacterium]
MKDEMMRWIEKAIEASSRWPETGWAATFGTRNVEVPNLKAAEALPKTAVYREEAVNYWHQVRLAGVDTAEAGRKALDALGHGDSCRAIDALYFCHYLEKPFEGRANTWIPLYEAIRESSAA